MPELTVHQTIRAPIRAVWASVIDIERYPSIMESVRAVRLHEDDGAGTRHSSWSVELKGSILEWEEEERIDPSAHTIEFRQLRGDLAAFDGRWELRSDDCATTSVTFEVVFEIGIPLLAEMLNPVAVRSLTDNCRDMLAGVERDVAHAA